MRLRVVLLVGVSIRILVAAPGPISMVYADAPFDASRQEPDDEEPIEGTIRATRGDDLASLPQTTEDEALAAAIAAVDGASEGSVEEFALTVEDGFLVFESDASPISSGPCWTSRTSSRLSVSAN